VCSETRAGNYIKLKIESLVNIGKEEKVLSKYTDCENAEAGKGG
jgi:hypothetical protein